MSHVDSNANANVHMPQVFVNGVWVGIHREPQTLVRTLRQLRRKVDVNTEVRAFTHFFLCFFDGQSLWGQGPCVEVCLMCCSGGRQDRSRWVGGVCAV